MDEQINKWLNGEISDEEFRASVGEADFTRYRQLLAEVDTWTPDKDEKIIQLDRIFKAKKEAKIRRMTHWLPLSVAASVIFCVAYFGWSMLNAPLTFETNAAEVKSIALPDGSKVILASASELKWDKRAYTKKKKRELRLKGKALFEVNKGVPFTVRSSVGSVDVLGTVFEVDDFEDGFQVTCFEGKVRATVGSGEARILEAGQSVIFSNGVWLEKTPFALSRPTYQEREVKFENAPLSQVIKDIERRFGIVVIAGSVRTDRRFTGSYPSDQLEMALKLIFNSLDIKYERKGSKVYLRS